MSNFLRVCSSSSYFFSLFSLSVSFCFCIFFCLFLDGDDMIQTALGFDFSRVETIAHFYAAQHFAPDVSFILDIGGQDMKV